MKREQAIAIKQVFEQCNRIEGKTIKLLPSKNNSAISNACQIHIQTNEDFILIDCLRNISKEQNVKVSIEGELAIIYS